jgi:hypothetical protein
MEKSAVPPAAAVNRKLGRVSAQVSDTPPSLLLFFATLFTQQAAASYPTGSLLDDLAAFLNAKDR